MAKHDLDSVIAATLQSPWEYPRHVVAWSRGRFIRRTYDGNKLSVSLLR